MSNNLTIQFTASLPFKIDKDEDWFISYCPLLDIYSQGTTEKEAEQNLREALSLFFITCLEMGTLDKVMKDCGFKVSKNVLDISQKPAQSMTMKYMDVPIPLIFEQMKGQQERCQV